MGKGEGCCGKSFNPEIGGKNAQVLEGDTGKWLPCEVKDIQGGGCCGGAKEYVVDYTPSTGGLNLETITVPIAKLREREAAIKLGPDGLPDLDAGRGCTDCLCLIFFAAFAAGWVLLATIAIDKGSPIRLLMPNDFRDEICGEFQPRTDYPEWFVPKPEYKLTYGICVAKCPTPGDIVCNNDWSNMAAFESSGLKWNTDPVPSDWGVNNKVYEMNATEVEEANAVFPLSSYSPDFGNGTTGTIAKVLSMWPNIPLDVLDPVGTIRNCDWRESKFGPTATIADRLVGEAGYPGGKVCTEREKYLLKKMVDVTPLVDSFNCFSATYRTDDLVHRCVPLSNDREQNSSKASQLKALAQSSAAGRYFSDGFGELKACWRVLLISAFTAIIISFIWLLLLRIMLRPIVYTILLLILAVLIIAGYACHVYANNLEDVTLPGDTSHDEQVKTWRAFSYVFWGVSCVYFVVMLWLISRIRIAICVLEQASMALFSAPSVLVIPPLMFIAIVGWLAWFLVLAAYIQTVQDVTTDTFLKAAAPATDTITDTLGDLLNKTDSVLSLSPELLDIATNLSDTVTSATNVSDARNGSLDVDSTTVIRYMHAYNFFGFLWMVQFFIAMAFFVISGVVIMWFWSASTAEILSGEKSKSTVPFAMKNAFYRMIRYHLGTLLFGSLLIAIIQFVRALLLYIEHQLPEELKESASFKIVKCLVHCFLAYLERIVKIINKNAFIITGIFGTSFCSSARRALCFLLANIARTAVLTAMAEVVMFLLKIFICGANVYLAMLMIKEESLTDDEKIESGLFPLFFVLLISFVIAVIVMNCYDTCITTVFMYGSGRQKKKKKKRGKKKKKNKKKKKKKKKTHKRSRR
eukprot:TRINITY_DN618_c0_g3_i1.p1 TRINITY_DN618_c0_g3~~TRINITY_DN618_c0_g3_i1.p1  ORF type:complete len:862 (+),score=130.31 TRINITY_DN618_c0_g3_i1:69-2654(+)